MTAASPHGDEVRLQVAALCWRRRQCNSLSMPVVQNIRQVNALRLIGEIEPGLIVSSVEGGEIAGRTIITKAGAFGTPQALRRVQRVLRGTRQL